MSSQVFQKKVVQMMGKSGHILFEQLEPRILLSADGLLNAILPDQDTLPDGMRQVVQYAELLETHEQVEEQVISDTSNNDDFRPILTLFVDDNNTNGESGDADLSFDNIGPAQTGEIALLSNDFDKDIESKVGTTEDEGPQVYVNDAKLSIEENTSIEIRGPPLSEIVNGEATSYYVDSEGPEVDNNILNEYAAEAQPSGILNLPGLCLVDSTVDYFEGQIVYLDFDGAEDVIYNGPVPVGPFDVPAFRVLGDLSGQEQVIITEVLGSLEQIFAGSGIVFTTEQPSGNQPYSTIYVGGDDSAFAEYGSFLGLAEKVDRGNADPSDQAFVFSENFPQQVDRQQYISNLVDVISHEVGHLLGGAHENETGQGVLDHVAAPRSVPPHVNQSGDIVEDGIILSDHGFVTSTAGGITVNGNIEGSGEDILYIKAQKDVYVSGHIAGVGLLSIEAKGNITIQGNIETAGPLLIRSEGGRIEINGVVNASGYVRLEGAADHDVIVSGSMVVGGDELRIVQAQEVSLGPIKVEGDVSIFSVSSNITIKEILFVSGDFSIRGGGAFTYSGLNNYSGARVSGSASIQVSGEIVMNNGFGAAKGIELSTSSNSDIIAQSLAVGSDPNAHIKVLRGGNLAVGGLKAPEGDVRLEVSGAIDIVGAGTGEINQVGGIFFAKGASFTISGEPLEAYGRIEIEAISGKVSIGNRLNTVGKPIDITAYTNLLVLLNAQVLSAGHSVLNDNYVTLTSSHGTINLEGEVSAEGWSPGSTTHKEDGGPGGTITIVNNGGAIIAENLNVLGGMGSLGGAQGSKGRIFLSATGNISQSATDGLLQAGTLTIRSEGLVTLESESNNVDTLAATVHGGGNFKYVDADYLTLGSISQLDGSLVSGIVSTGGDGLIQISTVNGCLFVIQDVNAANAGVITMSATAMGKNILICGEVVSDTGDITVHAGNSIIGDASLIQTKGTRTLIPGGVVPSQTVLQVNSTEIEWDGGVDKAIGLILDFNTVVDPTEANLISNYTLTRFDYASSREITLDFQGGLLVKLGDRTVRLGFDAGSLEPGNYRLEVSDAIKSPCGSALDGDADGSPGGVYRFDFIFGLTGDISPANLASFVGAGYVFSENHLEFEVKDWTGDLIKSDKPGAANPSRSDWFLEQEDEKRFAHVIFSDRLMTGNPLFSTTGHFVFAPGTLSDLGGDSLLDENGFQGTIWIIFSDSSGSNEKRIPLFIMEGYSYDGESAVQGPSDGSDNPSLLTPTQVAKIQQRLNYLGFCDWQELPLDVDAIRQDRTTSSIAMFQRIFGKTIPFPPDPSTWPLSSSFDIKIESETVKWLNRANAPRWVEGDSMLSSNPYRYCTNWVWDSLHSGSFFVSIPEIVALSKNGRPAGVGYEGHDGGMAADISLGEIIPGNQGEALTESEIRVIGILFSFVEFCGPATVGSIKTSHARIANELNTRLGLAIAEKDSSLGNSIFHIDFLDVSAIGWISSGERQVLEQSATKLASLESSANAAASATAGPLGMPVNSVTQASPGPYIGDFLSFGSVIQDYFTGLGADEIPSYKGLVAGMNAYAQSLWGSLNIGTPAQVTGEYDHENHQVQFTVDFNMQKTASFPFGIMGADSVLGIDLSSLFDSLELTVNLGLNYSFGLDLSGYFNDPDGYTLTLSDAFFELNSFTIGAHAQMQNLSFVFGDPDSLQLAVDGAELDFSLLASLTLIGDQRVSLENILDSMDLFDIDLSGSYRIFMPVAVTQPNLGRLILLTVSSNDFFGEAPDIEVELLLSGEVGTYLENLANDLSNLRQEIQPEIVENGNGEVIDVIHHTILSEYIPGTLESISSLLQLDGYFAIGDYINHYLHPALHPDVPLEQDDPIPVPDYSDTEGEPTLSGLLSFLDSYWISTLDGVVGRPLTWNLTDTGFGLSFNVSPFIARQIGLNMGGEVEDFGLRLDSEADLSLTVNADIDFDLTVDLDTADVVFTLNELGMQINAFVDNLYLGASFGPLEASIGDPDPSGERGSAELRLGGGISFMDEDGDGDKEFKFDPGNNSIDITLPVFASLAGVPLYSYGSNPEEEDEIPCVMISGSFYDEQSGFSLPTFSHKNFDQLLNFQDFTIGQIVEMLHNTLNWLSEMSGEDFMSTEIPIVNRNLSEILDFATTFNEQVLSKIDFDKATTIQGFIEEFEKVGILPEGIGINVIYNPVDQTIRLPVDFGFLLNGFDLRNLNNLGEVTFGKLVELGAVAPNFEMDKDVLLNNLLRLPTVELSDLVHWDIVTVDSFSPATTIIVKDMEDRKLIQEGILSGTIALSSLLQSDVVEVRLKDLLDYDLLSVDNLISGLMISCADLVASHLITGQQLLDSDVSLYDANLTLVEDLEEAEWVDLSELLAVKRFDLADAVKKDFIAPEDFNSGITFFNVIDLENAGLIESGDLTEDRISLADLLASELVSVSLVDLINAGLLDISNLPSVPIGQLKFGSFDLYELVDLGILTQNDITSFEFDIFNIKDLPIDLGLELGDALEVGTEAVANLQVTVGGGLEWVIDFDGLTGAEGLTFFIDNAEIYGEASFDLTPLEFFARLGFVELTAGGVESGVGLFAKATLTLDENEDGNPDMVSFENLIDALVPTIEGNAWARLKGLDVEPNVPGLNEAALADKEISITIPDLKDWSHVETMFDSELPGQFDEWIEQNYVVIVLPDLDDIFNFKDLDFTDIIEAIRMGVEFIETTLMEQAPFFYEQEIPIINRRVSEAFGFINDLLDKLELAADNPAAVIQEVEDIIEEALQINDINTLPHDEQIFSLSIDGSGVLKIHIQWDMVLSDLLSEDLMNISFSLNLGDIINMFTGGAPTDLDFINDLVSGGADISWNAEVSMAVDIGINFTDILDGDLDFFLYDYNEGDDSGTHVTIGLKVLGENLELMFNPFDIGVKGGSAYLGQVIYSDGGQFTHDYYDPDDPTFLPTGANFATFTLGIDQESPDDDDGRFYFMEESFSDNFFYDLVGGFDIYLPIEVPLITVSGPLHIYTNNKVYGANTLLHAFTRLFGGGVEGDVDTVIVDLPSFDVPMSFGLLDILNDPGYILDGVDFCLGGVEEVFGSALAQEIPLVGGELVKVATFIRDMRQGFLAELREKLSGKGKAIEYMRNALFDVFGPGNLNIILESDGVAGITEDDVLVGWYDAIGGFIKSWELGDLVPTVAGGDSADADSIQFNLELGGRHF